MNNMNSIPEKNSTARDQMEKKRDVLGISHLALSVFIQHKPPPWALSIQ